MEIIILISFVLYVVLNLLVTNRIEKAYYLKEERRVLHKRLIWILPFIGPFLIKSHWRRNKELKVMTKTERTKRNGSNTDDWQNLTGNGAPY